MKPKFSFGSVFVYCRRLLKLVDRNRSTYNYHGCRTFGSQPIASELTKEEVDQILRRSERTVFVGEGAVHSFDTNQLPANAPCEDSYACAKCSSTGSWYFGVFDGHGGHACSRAVASRIFDYGVVAVQPLHRLRELARSSDEEINLLEWFSASSYTSAEWSELYLPGHLRNLRRFAAFCAEKHESLTTVRTALQTAFVALDEDLSSDATSLHDGKLSTPHVTLVASGSCACLAQIRGPNLFLANVGDSSAVLGVCNEQGHWSARQLIHEHTIDNADEVKRIRSEHPAKEATTILKGGRLLGQLFPLRAFGDVRFKWPASKLREVLEKKLKIKVLPDGLETPPYLTAKPEVYYHRLTPNDKFLVIASDGLWELLTPERVVQLVGDHMIGRVTLSPYTLPEHATVDQVLQELRFRKQGESKKPMDVNAATHLIRFALGGTSNGTRQYATLSSLLGLPEGTARDYHDDITITIVYFDANHLTDETVDVTTD